MQPPRCVIDAMGRVSCVGWGGNLSTRWRMGYRSKMVRSNFLFISCLFPYSFLLTQVSFRHGEVGPSPPVTDVDLTRRRKRCDATSQRLTKSPRPITFLFLWRGNGVTFSIII